MRAVIETARKTELVLFMSYTSIEKLAVDLFDSYRKMLYECGVPEVEISNIVAVFVDIPSVFSEIC